MSFAQQDEYHAHIERGLELALGAASMAQELVDGSAASVDDLVAIADDLTESARLFSKAADVMAAMVDNAP